MTFQWRRILYAILPWPGRAERKAAIAHARDRRDVAREQAAGANQAAREIKRIAYEDNHFSAAIIATLRNRERGGGDSGPARR